ncbi:MAG: uracil-DNA glycosylase [Bacteroidota bacterium]|nr:uracil-DNA glycosylase [Bacteroidota bacterium]
MSEWERLQSDIIACARCLRLRQYCATLAQQKRAAYREWEYWGKPVPNFGSPEAQLLIVGLAPAAHGANRTGRMFTGDRSGDFLYRALYAAGFSNQPHSYHREDGLQLRNVVISAVLHCAPPQNRPSREEIAHCKPFLERTLELLPKMRGIVALGQIAFRECCSLFRKKGWLQRTPRFAHGMLVWQPPAPFLLASYHPSQQNTFTGRLSFEMLHQVFCQAAQLLQQPIHECPERIGPFTKFGNK